MLLVASIIESALRPLPTVLEVAKVENVSLIFGPDLLPSNLLAPSKLFSLSTIQDAELIKRVVHQLTPAKVTNTSLIRVAAFTGTATTSYDNPGGKGNRETSITVTTRRVGSTSVGNGGTPANLVDGDTAGSSSAAWGWQAASDYEIYFDFRPTGFKQIIDEITFRQNQAAAHGTWVVEAWNGNGTWAELKSAFTLGGVTVQAIPFFNSAAFLVYRLRQVTGPTSSAPWLTEFEFKIAQGAAISSSTAYTNPGGTGDRRATITASGTMTFSTGTPPLLVDGTTNASQTNFTSGQTGKDIKFALAAPKAIDEFRWYSGAISSSHGAWMMLGSVDDVTYEQLGTPFELKGATSFVPVVFAHIAGNVKAYGFYKLQQINGMQSASGSGISNTVAPSANNAEIEFKIAA